jgi:hypothetical protein
MCGVTKNCESNELAIKNDNQYYVRARLERQNRFGRKEVLIKE